MSRPDSSSVIAAVLLALIVLAILALAIGIRFWIAGGDWGCVFAQDTALCVAVKGAGR